MVGETSVAGGTAQATTTAGEPAPTVAAGGSTIETAAAAGAAAAAGVRAPAFEYANDDMSEKFNLRPRANFKGAIPEDQRKITQAVYEARNVLTLLKDDKAISDAHFKEFIERTTQAGFAGCVAENVDPRLAGEALEQIRADIIRRAATPLVYRYLRALALWAGIGGVVGLVIAVVGVNYRPILLG